MSLEILISSDIQIENFMSSVESANDEMEKEKAHAEAALNDLIGAINSSNNREQIIERIRYSSDKMEIDSQAMESKTVILKLGFFRDRLNRDETVSPSLKGRLIKAIDRRIELEEGVVERANRFNKALANH